MSVAKGDPVVPAGNVEDRASTASRLLRGRRVKAAFAVLAAIVGVWLAASTVRGARRLSTT